MGCRHVTARQNRCDGYLLQVRGWHELPGGGVERAPPFPLEPGVRGTTQQAKKTKQRKQARSAEESANAAAGGDAPSGSSCGVRMLIPVVLASEA